MEESDPGTPTAAPAVVADGGRRADRTAMAVALVAAVLVVALGLGSTALSDWFAPVVEGWL